MEAMCSGELLALSAGPDGRLEAAPAGALPRLSEPWVKAVPGLADSLKRVRQQQAADSLPSALIAAHGAAALTPLQTLAEFRAAVAAAPGPWCDGTAPDEPPLPQQEQALLTAGELAAFLAGCRGVCLLQLHKGWGDAGAALQPLLRPWVLALLREAAGAKGAVLLGSAAPENLGASVVLAARQQPWLAWGKHLAAQGVQSSIVADSPFYKLLIGEMVVWVVACERGSAPACPRWLPRPRTCLHAGRCERPTSAQPACSTLALRACSPPAGRILGYKPANIYHHIEVSGRA